MSSTRLPSDGDSRPVRSPGPCSQAKAFPWVGSESSSSSSSLPSVSLLEHFVCRFSATRSAVIAALPSTSLPPGPSLDGIVPVPRGRTEPPGHLVGECLCVSVCVCVGVLSTGGWGDDALLSPGRLYFIPFKPLNPCNSSNYFPKQLLVLPLGEQQEQLPAQAIMVMAGGPTLPSSRGSWYTPCVWEVSTFF